MSVKEIRNRQAYYQYEILEKIEAGIVLIGSEVKSIRNGDVTFADSYIKIFDGEAFLMSCHIAVYKNAAAFGHEPVRKRKLLLKKREILKLEKKVELRGNALIPLRLYFNSRGFAKIEIGVGRGKKLHDKREAAKEKDSKRMLQREISRFNS